MLYKWPDGDALSFGIGMAASDLILLKPGFIRIESFSPGFWYAYSERDHIIVGLTESRSPVGVAMNVR